MRMVPKFFPIVAMKGSAKALANSPFDNFCRRHSPRAVFPRREWCRVEPGKFNQPPWWGTKKTKDLLHGTIMEHAAIAQQPNVYMTNAMFFTWARDCLIPVIGTIGE